MKDNNHMILSVDAEKSFDKVQDFFTIKAFNKLHIGRAYLNIIESYMKTHS